MYVTIDTQAARFVHAHADRRVCSALASLELPDMLVCVQPADYPQDFAAYSTDELLALLINCTGAAFPGYARVDLLRMVAAAAQALPQHVATFEQVQAQLGQLAPNDSTPYSYAHGKRQPVPREAGARPLLSQCRDVGELLRRGNALAVPAPLPPATQPAAQAASARPPAAPPRAPSAPGQGSVTERIFTACDAAREELLSAGHSPDGLLEAARKIAIPRLEAAGVNGNSARKGSSMWLAARR